MHNAGVLTLLLTLTLQGCADDPAETVAGVVSPVARAAEPLPGVALLAPGQLAGLTAGLGLSDARQLPHYDLSLSLSDVSGRYEGRGTIRWTNTTGRAQQVIPLLLNAAAPAELGAASAGTLTLSEASVATDPGATLRQVRPTLAEVTLTTPLAPGDAVTLSVAFGGRLRQLAGDANDLFAQAFGGMGQLGAPAGASDYGLLGQGDGLVTAASATPQVAPFEDGEPVVAPPSGIGDLSWNQVGVYELQIVTPAGLEVVTNLVDGAPVAVDERTQLTRAEGAGVRDLVLVASRDFGVVERDVDGVTVRSWFLERDRAAGEASLEDAAASLAFLSRTYAPYPYTELDVVEASLVGGAGGVEFSGMVLIAGFLYRDPTTSQSPTAGMMSMLSGGGGLPPELAGMTDGQRRFVVAHEVVHQWSPGLVGADAHASPVVDEPLAQYLAGRVMQSLLGDAEGAEARDRNVMINYALYRLMGGTDGAADRPTHTFGSTLEYAALVYGKAPYLYVDLEERLGRARLDAAIAAAIKGRAWQVVDGDGWLDALEIAGATGARERGRRWWKEGYGDGDLGLDAEGRVAMRLMFGEELAAQVEQSFAMLGMSPAQLFQMMAGGMPAARPYQADSPSVEEMLELLGP